MKTITERVSVDKEDAGYAAWLKAGGWKFDWHVELDGEPVTKVITADPVKGELLRYLTNSDDEDVLNDDRSDILRETLTGNVTVRIDDRRKVGG